MTCAAINGGTGRRSAGRWARALLLAVPVLAAVGLALSLDVPDAATLERWFRDAGSWAWLAALAALSVALAVPTPRSGLSLLAGAVFGFPGGLGLVVAGGLIGGLAGFGLSRWIGRGLVTHLAGTRLAKVDHFLSSRGFSTVLTARLLPAPPFAVVSWAAGLSGVRLAPYAAGTALGILPGSVFYVGIGASVTSADSVVAWLAMPWHVAGVVLTAGALAAGWWLRRRRAARRPE